MQLQVNFEDSVCSDQELVRRLEGVLEGALERFGDRISRVSICLEDLNSVRMGEPDKSCRLEARVPGLAPVTVSHQAATLSEAIHGAADKLRRLLARELRQLDSTEAPLIPLPTAQGAPAYAEQGTQERGDPVH
jgi:hypothetical protein